MVSDREARKCDTNICCYQWKYTTYGNNMLFDTVMTIHVNSLKLLRIKEHKITLLYSDFRF